MMWGTRPAWTNDTFSSRSRTERENCADVRTLEPTTLPPRTHTQEGQTSPDISSSQKPRARVNFRTLMHNSFLRNKRENSVKTNYHQGEISVYVSALRLLPTEAKETTDSGRDVIHISVAEISIRSDSDRFVVSLQTLPTHTYTRARRGNCVW